MYRVRKCEGSDLEEVRRLLREVYYPEEPLTRVNSLIPEPALPGAIIPQGHSYVAESLVDGTLVGVAMNDRPPQSFATIYTYVEEDRKFREMFAWIEAESGVLSESPEALEVKMLAVDGSWRGRGIATDLLDATRREALIAGYPFLKIYCTSNHSSRLVSKLGWRLLYSMKYLDYLSVNPLSGIKAPAEPHSYCKLYIDNVEPASGLDIPMQHNCPAAINAAALERIRPQVLFPTPV